MTLLNTHSHYSLLRGVPKIKNLVENVKKKGYKSVALTDTARMHGMIEFYKECKANDIKPLLGVSLFLPKEGEGASFAEHPRITLIAKNNDGYKALIKLVTKASINEINEFSIIKIKDIEPYTKDLITIIPSVNGETAYSNTLDRAKEKLKEYSKLKNLYLGISHQNIPDVKMNDELHHELAKETGTPLVALPIHYYLEPNDNKTREVLIKIKGDTRGPFEEEIFSSGDLFIHSNTDFKKMFANEEEALKNADKIAEECNVELEIGNWIFPSPPTKGNKEKILREKVDNGLKNRNIEMTTEVKKRLEFELDTIIKLGYAPYFLVVNDLLEYARKEKINYTTRGSVAGSLVSYLLGITTIDPIKYSLPFERFLNPFRPSPPDIDMDFSNDKRTQIIEYIKEVYGKDKVAQIGTFGTFMARASVRDVARALGYNYATGDQIARQIPIGKQGAPMTIDKAMEETDELREIYDRQETARHIIDTAKLIEGNVRHISTHAAGIVISPVEITDYIPLQKDPIDETKLLTQYSMNDIEAVGLLKFDILGLKNLSIIRNTVKEVKRMEDIEIDIDNLPEDDKATMRNISQGETVGMFQLNGDGMTAILKRLKPTSIKDVNAMIALFRPGPMANIDKYIRRKHGEESVKYFHPKMEEFLKDSYGVLVYQEDVMFTALALAGYTWETVDAFRKAIGKKIPKKMEEQHKIFVEGCKKHSNLTEKQAEELWKLFDPFKGYGFNKAHAAAYGYVSYQSAYLKTHFSAYYIASTLSIRSGGDIQETALYIREAKRLGIDVLPPNVNGSNLNFSTHKREDGSYFIRFGLYFIKRLGTNIAELICKERNEKGEFKDLSDFLVRMSTKVSQKNIMETLVLSGALDCFGEREILYGNISRMIEYAKEADPEKAQVTLFGRSPIELSDKEKSLSKTEKLYWERELLGFYISGHPIDDYMERKRDLINFNDIKDMSAGSNVNIICVIGEVHHRRTKTGKRMAVLLLEDEVNFMEGACFGQTLASYEELIAPHRCVMIAGRLDRKGDLSSIVIEKIRNV